MFRRIVGRYADMNSGPNTLNAERILSLDPQVYFYVEVCAPQFGQQVLVSRAQRKSLPDDAKITPFDSGGLALGKINLNQKLTTSERVALLTLHSYDRDQYLTHFRNWIRKAFSRARDYSMWRRPTLSLVSEVDIRRSRARAWLWEARLPKRDYVLPPVKPVIAFVRRGDKMRYLAWFRSARSMNVKDGTAHVRMFTRISKEVRSPASSATRFLIGGGGR